MSKERVLSITKIYYSNPKIQKAIFNFSKDREVVPRYANGGFGKRPDTLQYFPDLMGLVNKGATSFHASEEIWADPFRINSEMEQEEMDEIRNSWDLLIDIDSPYLDYSKIAAKLICETLENFGIKNYGLKFSGSKGFHIIVSGDSFPKNFNGKETKKMFPEWPRAISQFLMYKIRRDYNKIVSKDKINFEALKERTNLSKEEIMERVCPICGESAKKANKITLKCDTCNNLQIKPNYKITQRKLKCIEESCPGHYEVEKEDELFLCENCGYNSFDKTHESDKKITYTREAKQAKYSDEFKEEVSGERLADLDLVLVAPRHLFRMPYSLHEKTCLASVVLKKEQLDSFSPNDANPMKVKVLDFYPSAVKGEATSLLESALEWKTKFEVEEETRTKKKYGKFEKITVSGVTENHFPRSIKKLLKGLKEGRKRGLFILLTFLKCLNFSPEFINTRAREWNKTNNPPLKEGYVKSQIDWILRQKKQILPPNYSNRNFYKDLKLIDELPKVKNPIVEVLRKIRQES